MGQSVYPPTTEGPVDHDAPISGKPLGGGGRASSATPGSVSADGDAVRQWMTRAGASVVALPTTPQAGSDAFSNNWLLTGARDGNSWPTPIMPLVFNGSSWDRLRGDTLGVSVSRAAAAATAARSDVAASASSVTVLALNAARKGATIYNDSAEAAFLKFGTTASSSDFTVKVAADGYFEVPFGYTGRIDGIWGSATGNARVTELT